MLIPFPLPWGEGARRRRAGEGSFSSPLDFDGALFLTVLYLYAIPFILGNMKIGERGQVTIPKELREKFGLKPETEVEFQVVNNSIILRKKPRKLALTRWKGRCKKSFEEFGYTRVDEFIKDVRGRRH
jgi:AbrB family looped-hinge helix DNA binding protein